MNRCILFSLSTLAALVLSAGCQSPGGRASQAIRPGSAGAVNGDFDELHPRVKIATTMGDIVCELDGEHAAPPVIHFLQYAQKGFYDNTLFHRVVADALIQGGGYNPKMELKPATLTAPMPDRWLNDLKNERGTIALIRGRGAAGTGTAEFFVNVVHNERLDEGGAKAMASVFGKVVGGMDVVDRIRNTPVASHPDYAEGRSAVVPAKPIIIKSVRLITPYDQTVLEDFAAAQPGAEDHLANVIKALKATTGRPSVKTESGIEYVVQHVGKGATPLPDDFIEFQYRGTLPDGTEFESTYQKRPAIRRVADLIPGLQEMIMTMNEGGKRTAVIPPELAFGSGGVPGFIPSNATIVFEIELLGIRESGSPVP